MVAEKVGTMALVETTLWERVSRKRICFGHQSVGGNLIDAIMAGSGGRLNVIESVSPETFRRPVFAHFRVGQNRDPLSKFESFQSMLESGVGERIDVAFFKLCYVDITAHTDIDELFRTYRQMMDALSRQYPAVTFLHVTVPLRRLDDGWLRWMRARWHGDDIDRLAQAKRHAYNELLRAEYGSLGRLFDLAGEEATFPDGRTFMVQYKNKSIPSLVSDYTGDGGHLNKAAAQRIAAELLRSIGSIDVME